MTDISTVWDVAEASGDWDFVPTVVKTTQLQINAQPFVVGGPSGTAFSLLGGAPGLSQPVAGSIYRNDWQGNQLLYPTPRTNTCPQSQSLQSWTTNSSPTVSANAAVAPDGTTTATLISGTGSANCGIFKQSSGITTSVGTVVTFSTYVQFQSGTPSQRLFLQGTAFPLSPFATFNTQTGAVTGTSGLISSSSVAIGGGWFRVSMTASATVAGIATPVLYSGTTSAFGNYLWGAQVELSTSVPTAYIPTTASAVTVTDYTQDAYGDVTIPAPLPIGAQLLVTSPNDGLAAGTVLANGDGVSTQFAYRAAYTGPTAGAYGSINLNAQFFVTAYRPNSAAAYSNIGGYKISVGAYATPSQLMYASLSQFTGGVTDSSIYACVAATKAEGTIAWVSISN